MFVRVIVHFGRFYSADCGNPAVRKIVVDVLEICLELFMRFPLGHVVGELLQVSNPEIDILPVDVSDALYNMNNITIMAWIQHLPSILTPICHNERHGFSHVRLTRSQRRWRPAAVSSSIPAVAAGSTPSVEPIAGRSLKQALADPERQLIREVLEAHNWCRNAAAQTLGINRTTLYKKMKRLGLEDIAMAMGR
jgi:hypothetical protein